jgi:uncharacterized protein GlcG (DUF336 family)
MRSLVIACSFAVSAFAGAALAQQAPAPAAAPAPVPDQMPFDIPYGAHITADKAAKAVAATIAEATKSPRNWKLAIAVVDTNGDLVYFQRMDQTQIASVNIAINKARTAARFRRESAVFAGLMSTPAGAFAPTLDPTLTASPGGIPLVEGGKIIGAIGCSGATGPQDQVACKAGADTIK